MKKVFVFFTLRLLFILIIAVLAVKFTPYKGFFPYKENLPLYQLPSFLYSFANFDGLHYLSIAKENYHQYQQVFFPLYPILIRFFSGLFKGNYLISGLFISNLSFLIGLLMLYNLSKLSQDFNFNWTLLFLLSFPTAFFFNSVYTEGLFFMLFSTTLYLLKKKSYLSAGLTAALSSSSRLIGILLFLPFIFSFNRKIDKRIIFAVCPFIGIFIFMVYLLKTTGDPFYFFHAQSSLRLGRSTNFILLPQVYFRYLKIFFLSQFNFQYLIALSEFASFTFFFIICLIDLVQNIKKKNYFYVSIVCFSLLNILIPSLTGTFLSMPRFALFSITVFFYLSRLKSRVVKSSLLIFFGLLQTIFLSFFIQGYFIS